MPSAQYGIGELTCSLRLWLLDGLWQLFSPWTPQTVLAQRQDFNCFARSGWLQALNFKIICHWAYLMPVWKVLQVEDICSFSSEYIYSVKCLFKNSAQKQPENRADLTIKTNFQPKTAQHNLSGKIKKDINSAPKPLARGTLQLKAHLRRWL